MGGRRRVEAVSPREIPRQKPIAGDPDLDERASTGERGGGE